MEEVSKSKQLRDLIQKYTRDRVSYIAGGYRQDSDPNKSWLALDIFIDNLNLDEDKEPELPEDEDIPFRIGEDEDE